MKYFSIMDLQRDAISHIKRDYWNAVMIGAIIYGVSLAVGMLSSFITVPLQMFSGLFAGFTFAKMPYNISSLPGFLSNIGIMIVPYLLLSLLPMAISIAMEPVNTGARLSFLDIAAGRKAIADTIFKPFKRFLRFVGSYLWYALFVLLWSLLFIVPGMIKAYSYFMMPYLVAEYPDIPIRDAMKLSMRITMGYKHKIFFMYLLLFAWGLLIIPAAIITCGLGGIAFSLLWLAPLSGILCAVMYNKLKILAFEEGRITPKDLYIAPASEPQM